MAPGDEWDAEKMLQVYILDYMKKKNMHTAADVFATEANVGSNPIAIESAGGFLAEWWSIFYDVFASRQAMGEQGTSQQEARGDGSSLEIQTTENELHSLHPLVPNFEMNQQTPGLFTNLENMLGQQSSSLSAAKMRASMSLACFGFKRRDFQHLPFHKRIALHMFIIVISVIGFLIILFDVCPCTTGTGNNKLLGRLNNGFGGIIDKGLIWEGLHLWIQISMEYQEQQSQGLGLLIWR